MNLRECEELVKEYKQMQVKVKIYEDEIESIEVVGLSSIDFEAMAITANGRISKPTENEAIGIAEKKSKMEKAMYIMRKRIKLVDLAISSLAELEKEVVVRKLIESQPYYRICGDLHISERYAKQIKKQALLKMLKAFPSRLKP